jgi:hypothetical protein
VEKKKKLTKRERADGVELRGRVVHSAHPLIVTSRTNIITRERERKAVVVVASSFFRGGGGEDDAMEKESCEEAALIFISAVFFPSEKKKRPLPLFLFCNDGRSTAPSSSEAGVGGRVIFIITTPRPPLLSVSDFLIFMDGQVGSW